MGLNLGTLARNHKDLKDAAQRHFASNKYNGEFYLPTMKGYDDALYDCTRGNFGNTKIQPFALLIPSNSEDVAQILCFAHKFQIKITVVGGGHSEFSVKSDAAIVHLKRFNSVELDESKLTVTFGGGCILGEIGEMLAKHNLAAPVGTFWTVGCGLVLQGGIGHLTRIASVACENIQEVELILPNGGRIVTLNEKVMLMKNDDNENDSELLRNLWWAIRGAGTMFGIVTRIKLNVYPVSTVLKATPVKILKCKASEYEKIHSFSKELELCEGALRNLPHDQHGDVTLIVKKSEKPETDDVVIVSAFFKLISLEKKPFSEEILKVFNLDKNDHFKIDNYLDLSTAKPSEARKKGGNFNYTRTLWVDQIGSNFFEIITTALVKAPTSKCLVSFQQTGGMVRNSPEFMSDSCFKCRNFEFSVVLVAVWPEEDVRGLSGYEIDMKYRSWVDNLAQDLKPIVTGYYPVDIDVFRRPTSSWNEAIKSYGIDALQRLKTIKNVVDPDNIIGIHIALEKPE